MSDKTKIKTDRKEKLKEYTVYVLCFIVFAGIIWLIYAPSASDKEKEKQGTGFNTDIPDPKKDEIIGDKQDAYERDQMEKKQKDRMMTLEDMATLLGSDSKMASNDLDLETDSNTKKEARKNASQLPSPIQNSATAYRDINRTLGNFYEKPKEDTEKQELKAKLEELEAKLEEKESKKNAMDDQLELMEKSYQLAAKYMPQGQNQGNPYSEAQPSGIGAEEMKNKIVKSSSSNTSSNGKTKVAPIKQIREQTVTALSQYIGNDELINQYDQPRNFGFNTVDAKTGISEKNTISAIVDNDQVLVDGQSVRLRLTESLLAGNTVIPLNTILSGKASIQGERLNILINSIEFEGTILLVELSVYDSDGQKGIYIPGSLEMNAIKEIAANMGNSVGTSFTMTQSASQQIASDLTKGVIQGASQYMTKKIRQVKVTLKSGYKLMLMPKENH